MQVLNIGKVKGKEEGAEYKIQSLAATELHQDQGQRLPQALLKR